VLGSLWPFQWTSLLPSVQHPCFLRRRFRGLLRPSGAKRIRTSQFSSSCLRTITALAVAFPHLVGILGGRPLRCLCCFDIIIIIMPWALIHMSFITSRQTWINSQKFVKYITYSVRKNWCIFDRNLLFYLYYKQNDKQSVEFTKTLLLPSVHSIVSSSLLPNLVSSTDNLVIRYCISLDTGENGNTVLSFDSHMLKTGFFLNIITDITTSTFNYK
jgi:hypothetical protein